MTCATREEGKPRWPRRQRLAGGARPGFNNAVYLSERQTADRNFALGYSMREAGRLDSIVAVPQATPAPRRIGDPDRARAAHNGRRADQGAWSPVRAGR
jgi:hypothetical protein